MSCYFFRIKLSGFLAEYSLNVLLHFQDEVEGFVAEYSVNLLLLFRMKLRGFVAEYSVAMVISRTGEKSKSKQFSL